ncbi:unnamed protein product [Caenorhabditis angaria]|uniref:7TM GPCR serpentine receptor class x (Srx) domain-containing protein n=1 Tax=Caenorhabditis angaria TaxID=860376 RepID=A0A9P1IYQ9_9PELO|nr:unnamed protein product [Caenorhabditis angaria]
MMATNRLLVIVYSQTSCFTKKKLSVACFLTIIFAAVKSYLVQYIFPCCAFIVDQGVYSYSYYTIDGRDNLSDISDIPLNALTSISTIIFYSLIFKNIHDTRRSIQSSMTSFLQKKRRNQEIKYAFQFCFISFFYTFGWILFRLFHILFKNQNLGWFILIGLFNVCNTSANAFVYLIFDREVKRQFKTSQQQKSPTVTIQPIQNIRQL